MLLTTIPFIDSLNWNSFIVTMVLVFTIIFTTLFYVAWKKYKNEKKMEQDKEIDAKNNFD